MALTKLKEIKEKYNKPFRLMDSNQKRELEKDLDSLSYVKVRDIEPELIYYWLNEIKELKLNKFYMKKVIEHMQGANFYLLRAAILDKAQYRSYRFVIRDPEESTSAYLKRSDVKAGSIPEYIFDAVVDGYLTDLSWETREKIKEGKRFKNKTLSRIIKEVLEETGEETERYIGEGL